jgi:hypothetical protein
LHESILQFVFTAEGAGCLEVTAGGDRPDTACRGTARIGLTRADARLIDDSHHADEAHRIPFSISSSE